MPNVSSRPVKRYSMESLYISIDDYVAEQEVVDVERAVEEIERESYLWYSSSMNRW